MVLHGLGQGLDRAPDAHGLHGLALFDAFEGLTQGDGHQRVGAQDVLAFVDRAAQSVSLRLLDGANADPIELLLQNGLGGLRHPVLLKDLEERAQVGGIDLGSKGDLLHAQALEDRPQGLGRLEGAKVELHHLLVQEDVLTHELQGEGVVGEEPFPDHVHQRLDRSNQRLVSQGVQRGELQDDGDPLQEPAPIAPLVASRLLLEGTSEIVAHRPPFERRSMASRAASLISFEVSQPLPAALSARMAERSPV